MRPGLREAIEEAVQKWRGLIDNEIPASFAVTCCSLCNYTSDRAIENGRSGSNHRKKCDKYCPLAQAGFNCLDDGSAWNRIRDGLDIEDDVGENLADYPDLIESYEAIYKALVSLLPEEDTK